jgi:hypothetical protein
MQNSREITIGTWFLSYLSEAGYLDQKDDEVRYNYINAKLKQSICGIPVNTDVVIEMTQKDQMTIHYMPETDTIVAADDTSDEDSDGDEYDRIQDNPRCLHKKVKIQLNFSDLS